MTPEEIMKAKYASAMQMIVSQVDTIFTLRAQLEDAMKQNAELSKPQQQDDE